MHKGFIGRQMEKIFTQATVLIIPGLRDHVAEHWQTLLESRLAKVRSVAPAEIDQLNCANRVARIQAELEKIQGPVILVAHSAGVLMTLHWAVQHQHDIQGALLVAPPDLSQSWPANYPSPDLLKKEGWSPLPNQKLPFPSIVVASTNDHLAQFDEVEQMAKVWGSQLVNAGAVGHLNPAAGFGSWPMAEQLIAQLDAVNMENI
ncbi:alpha/beta hydrolase [Acinetobacter pragensis]